MGQLRQRLVDNIIRELHPEYVAPEKTKEISVTPATKLRSGGYDKIENAQQFARGLDHRPADSRQGFASIGHLRSWFGAGPDSGTFDAELRVARTAAHCQNVSLELREANYNFRKLEIMSGNVGYLDLRCFVDLNLSKETAVAAMNFLANYGRRRYRPAQQPRRLHQSRNFPGQLFLRL